MKWSQIKWPQAHWNDRLAFLRATTTDPALIGAIGPSGPALARLITSEIGSHSGHIVELGPGTGVFTRALLAQGVREQDLTLIEYCSDFAQLLEKRFPEARVLQLDAGRLHRHSLFRGAAAGATVSGLPLLIMPPQRVLSILRGAFRNMRPNGVFYQFTYSPLCPIPRSCLSRLDLSATCLGRAFANLPPASVYRISRRQPVSA